MWRAREIFVAWPGVLIACVCGACSRPDLPLAEVTGMVTFNGSPAIAEIIFEPVRMAGQSGGRPSMASTAPDGTFRMGYSAKQTGAVVGRHRVLVKILPASSGGPSHSYSASRTPLKVARFSREVRPGSNSFQFAITF